MKTFSEFITEAPNDTPEFVTAAVVDLKKRLIDTLGDLFVVKVGISRLGMHNSIVVTIYGANPTNGISQNSPCWMNLWMHDAKEGGVVYWESNTVSRVLKFRKISANTVSDANDKLVAWFKKVKETMIGLRMGP